MGSLSFPSKTAEVNHDYDTYIAGGFAPFPVAIAGAKGSTAFDVDGKSYIDFHSMIAVNNMGHGHPKILDAAIKALQEGATVNLAVQSPYYGKLAKRVSEVFGYDRFVALTSGGEAADGAVKIARKWGQLVKEIPQDQSFVLSTTSCYHGLGLSTLSLFSRRSTVFGPFLPNSGCVSPSGVAVRFGVLEDVEKAFEADGKRIAALIMEPIQGVAGVITPPDDYLLGVAALCKKHNILLIMDEIQTGLGRCGFPLCHQKYGVRPDLVVLGKGLAGGVYPVSGVIGDNHIMGLLDPGEVGSTMAANPPGCAAAIAALDVMVDEDLSARANEMGKLFLDTLQSHSPKYVTAYTGSGLLIGIVLDEKPPLITARRVVALLLQRGMLANACRGGILRICPPLTIERELIIKGAEMIAQALADIETVPKGLPGETIHVQHPDLIVDVA